MLADVTPPPPTWSISQQQQADLDCLTFAHQAGRSATSRSVDVKRMSETFATRLHQSDSAKDWSAMAAAWPDVAYGWFMGQDSACRERMKDPARLPAPYVRRFDAALRLDADQASFLSTVETGPLGYRFVVRCDLGCPGNPQYVESVSDGPISLFRLSDGDNLIYSLWSGGSAYWVRVWRVDRAGVSKLLEASTRDRPAFTSGPNGEPEVRTYEADGGTQPRQEVTWRYTEGRFSRIEGRTAK